MGIAYRLRFSAPSASATAEILRKVPTAREASSPGIRFEFGFSVEGCSQATVEIEASDVRFCDHCGGLGRAILGEVLVRLVSAFGAVTM